MSSDVFTVRSTDPRRVEYEAKGYELIGESWGARLRFDDPPDLSVLYSAMNRSEIAEIDMVQLGRDSIDSLVQLESANEADYPSTIANAHSAPTPLTAGKLWDDGCVVFGAFDGSELVGVTVMSRLPDRGETKFTSVRASHRRRGVAAALKATAIIYLVDEGVRVFGTGGAHVNLASRRMNESLGYVIEETWLSYRCS